MSIAFRLAAPVAAALLAASAAWGQPAPSGVAADRGPDLAAILHLRPEQMAAYAAYQSGAQPSADQIAVLRAASPPALQALTTPVRLQRLEAALTIQLQMFRRQADAVRAFYAQLSPDQRVSFDQLTGQPPGRGGSAQGSPGAG